MNVRIVRLQSGEDIIAEYEEKVEEGIVFLNNPMSLLFKRLPTGKAIMLMSPWLPTELVEQNNTWLYSQDILAVMHPKTSLVSYYGKSVKDLQIEMLQSSQEVEDSLNNYDDNHSFVFDGDEEEEEYGEPSDEEIEELTQLRQDTKKRLLH